MISCNKMDIAGMREEGNGNGTFNDSVCLLVQLCELMAPLVVVSLVASTKVPMVELSIKVSYDSHFEFKLTWLISWG